jgi:hypothetical protein
MNWFIRFMQKRQQKRNRTDWRQGYIVGLCDKVWPDAPDIALPRELKDSRRHASTYFNEGYAAGYNANVRIVDAVLTAELHSDNCHPKLRA